MGGYLVMPPRRTAQVLLVDTKKPDAFAVIFAAVIEVAPWAAEKVCSDHCAASFRPRTLLCPLGALL